MSGRIVVVEECDFAHVEPGWVVWDQNGSWREVERIGEDWVHEESGATGPTILLRFAPSAVIHMTGARDSIALRRRLPDLETVPV